MEKQARTHFIIGKLCMEMSRNQNNSFLDVFKFIQDEHKLKLHDIPNNEADLRRIFLDGKYSLRNIIPIPDWELIDEEGSQHAFVLPSTCLKHVMAAGVDIANLLDPEERSEYCTSLLNCQEAEKIVEKVNSLKSKTVSDDWDVSFVGAYTTFSDDWSPYSHVTAQECSMSVWSYHVSLVTQVYISFFVYFK